MSIIDNLEATIWVERYRPKCVADTILPDRIKNVLKEYADSKQVRSYTAIGSAGSGKTSSARALLEEIDAEYLLINASETGNIETIRTKVREYASKMTLSELGYKVIILDEADGLSIAAQNALRGVIEEFQEDCRFILTANYANKVSDAIKSRCPVLEFSFMDKEEKTSMLKQFFGRVEDILKENSVHYDRAELLKFCNKNFPDFRKSLNLISRNVINNTLELKNVGSANDDKIAEINSFIKGCQWDKMRKWVAESMDTEPALVRRALYESMDSCVTKPSKLCLTMILNEYDYKESFVVDKEINMVAMFTQMINSVVEGDLEYN